MDLLENVIVWSVDLFSSVVEVLWVFVTRERGWGGGLLHAKQEADLCLRAS